VCKCSLNNYAVMMTDYCCTQYICHIAEIIFVDYIVVDFEILYQCLFSINDLLYSHSYMFHVYL